LMLIFQSLELILLRTASDLSRFNLMGSSIVKKTVSSHMKLLQSSLYSGNRQAGNLVLLQFVVSLKQALEDEKVADLLVSILKCNPDILHRYFKESQLCFTPRMKGAWLDSIALLKKIYQSQPEVSQAFQFQEVVPVPRFLSMVLVTSLPPICNKAFFTQGLNLRSVVGQHATLTVMAFVLRRAQKNIEHCMERAVLDNVDGHGVNAKEEFVQLYREALSKVLPDIITIVSMWQSLSKNGSKEHEVQKGLTKVKTEEVETQDQDDHRHELILFKVLLLQVICLYQKVLPHLVTETKFDFSKMLKGMVSEKGMKEDVPPILQYQLLQLALELPVNKFSWFRFQDVLAPECVGRERSVLYVLLKMFVNSSKTQLRATSRMLLLKVLKESSAFEHNWKELELWLDQLLHLESSQQETVVQFLDLVLTRVVLNPYIYMDKVAVMVQEAVHHQAKIRGQDMNSSSLSISHFDGVLCEYICAVLCDILHSQRDPLALCLTLQNYDTELLSSQKCIPHHSSISHFHKYYFNWLSNLLPETQAPEEQAVEVVDCMLRVLHALFLKLFSIPETPPTPSETQEEESSYFDVTATAIQEVSKEQVLLAVFRLVFNHPVLQQWFFSLEMGVIPSPSLDINRMRQLCGQLTQGVLNLLTLCVETLRALHALEVISPYLSAIQQSLLNELQLSRRSLVKQSQTVEAFLALFECMDPSSVSEALSALLLLPQRSLLAGGDRMSLYGHAVLTILTKSISHDLSGNTMPSLSQMHLRSLAALYSSCYSVEMEDFFLQILRREPGCAKLIPTDIVLHCLQSHSSLELAALLVQNCSTHCLTFELWCLEQTDIAHITAQNSSFLSLLSSYLQQVTNEDPCRPKDIEKAVLQMLTKALLDELSSSMIKSSPENITDLDWNIFVKSGLKYRYKDKMFLCTLNSLLEPVYGTVLTAQGLLPIETLHIMVTSHSLFLPTMLAPQDDPDISPYSKEALVTLLLTIVKKCPEVCKSNHFHVLLGAYGATLSHADQKMLLLLKEYEKNNSSLMEFQYLLWGHAAVEYHKARKSLGPSLWQQLSSEMLLDQLDGDRMLNTVAHFPLYRHFIPQANEEFTSKEEKDGSPDQMCLYDPSFLIHLFSYIVRPESVLDCRKFVCSHALGLTLVALSSYDYKMRAAAYHVLGSFYQHVESVHFKEKKQLLYLLDTLRNAIQKQNLRVSFMHATYVAKVAEQILRPEEHMYLVISKFLLGTQYVDLKRVPDFFRLFYSFDLEHKLEREWLLKVLEEGMKDKLCYELCEQQSIFHTLLGFCSSPLCDQPVQ
ncbi:nucleolar pre-ribosomal-associated protein 1, partial [Clarias magur]